MTSRYALFTTGKLLDRYNLVGGLPKGVKPHYNVRPTMESPVILEIDGQIVTRTMMWGLVTKGAKDINSVFRYKTFNVPIEKVLSIHSRESAVRNSRCLVPVNGYYELVHNQGGSHAYYTQVKGQPLFSLAGIYSSWQDPAGKIHGTYSIITIDADYEGARSDRMPVILSVEDEAKWLDPEVQDANSIYRMLKTNPGDQLQTDEVSIKIKSPKFDKPSLIEPLK